MSDRIRSLSPWIVGLVSIFFAASAFAQVPQNTTFAGTLFDDAGDPLVGPVTFDLYLWDAPTGGSVLYIEQHASVPLDAEGSFAVLLGTGSINTIGNPPFDAALFSSPERYLEVRVDSGSFLPEILTPRLPLASVPWALVAQQANRIVPDPNGAFEDCGDGTVWDPKTGLQWEKKTGTVGTSVFCDTAGCPDPHDVNNVYAWSDSGAEPDGNAFTDFLSKLNDPVFGVATSPNDVTGCFAGHCDWRLATSVELQTIQDCSLGAPCIDSIFGPTAAAQHWSASTTTSPTVAFRATFNTPGGVDFTFKDRNLYVRAVRTGACH